ncbi:MAG: MotA/TolQ/ExbB proton channel family protein [Planctomycetota bacterium]|nr:MotA/TolQ/ExbB proton channel family protein [Planctomycetota bacterium]
MFYSYIEKAGIWWMLPILALSVVAVAFVLERSSYWWYHRVGRKGRRISLGRWASDAEDIAGLRDQIQAMNDQTVVPLATVFDHLESVGVKVAVARGRAALRLLVETSDRGSDVLALIARMSGSLGLLGTVAGVSLSFETMALADPKGLALALSTAMYTTLGGVFLFLLSSFALFVFEGFGDRMEARIEEELVWLEDRLDQSVDSRPKDLKEAIPRQKGKTLSLPSRAVKVDS